MSEYIIDGSDRRSPKAARNASIYEERKAGAKFIEIAGKYGLTVERIRQICRKEQWYRSRIDGLQPIVRCRDCENAQVFHPLNPITGVPAGIEYWRCAHFWNADELCDVEPDGFCAWGERRDA